jgi:uncharacterized protein (TIGR03437 family)
MRCRAGILGLLLCGPVAAASLEIEIKTVDAFGRASIAIAFSAAGKAVSALQFDIRNPAPDSLQWSVTTGPAAASAGKSIFLSDPAPANKRVLIAGANRNAISEGVVAILAIQLKPGSSPGGYPLEIAQAAAAAPDGGGVPLEARPGAVIVDVEGIPPRPIIRVVNGASNLPGPVSPGEIIVAEADGLATALKVTFDGIPAPLVYATDTRLSAIVPYALDGRARTLLQIESADALWPPFSLEVAPAVPGIFTADRSGTGQGAILNEDGSPNGPANPAAAGSIVSVFATGEGQTVPPGVDGSIVLPPGLRRPVLPVTLLIGGFDAEVLYAGSAPGHVSGLFQVNARVPLSVLPGSSVPLVLTVGRTSQPGVTMSVRAP